MIAATRARDALAGTRVLVVEDEAATREVLTKYLRRLGADARAAANLTEALGLLGQHAVDLLVTDVDLAGESGLQLLGRVKIHWPMIPVMVMTGQSDAATVMRALNGGADAYLLKPFDLGELRQHAEELVLRRAQRLRLEVERVELRRRLDKRSEQARSLIVGAVRSLVQAVEARDPYTRGHSERVSEVSVALAEAHGRLDLEKVRLGAELHDIGKIGVPDAVLNKCGRLTPEETEKVREHPLIGITILRPLFQDRQILAMTLHHHERWDGLGYPKGLAGDEIPVAVQLLSVADVLDAMTSSRAYRPALDWDVAVAEIERQAGAQLSPAAVAVFRACEPELRARHQALRPWSDPPAGPDVLDSGHAVA